MNEKKYILLGLAFIVSFAALAQTTNIGRLTISPNTQIGIENDFDNNARGIVMNDGELFLYANFNNNGLYSYFDAVNNGLTNFQSEVVQKITGDALIECYNVEFDNSVPQDAIELIGDIHIVNEANFESGIVNNDDFGGHITFGDDASYTGTFDGSHVNGKVEKNGDDSFEYPIGNGQFYRHASISAPDNTTDVFTAKYYNEDASGGGIRPFENRRGVIEVIDTDEYWTITNDSGSSEVLLTLSWNSETTPFEVISSPQFIRVVRWDETEQLWLDEGGLVDVDNKTVTTPIALENYGIFTLGRVKDIILPGDVIVYNGVTPNDDDKNDSFIIDNIQTLSNNKVEIFNRWGVQVFSTTNYDSNNNVFKGYSNGRLTMDSNNFLPTGTYFYVLSYDFSENGTTQRIKKAGYLYLTTE